MNQDGVRFMNESLAADFSRGGNAVIAQTKAFVILDKAYLDKMTDEALPVGLESVGIISGELFDGRSRPGGGCCSEGRRVQGRYY